MANYKFYKKDTGEIVSEHYGHPHDKDTLTVARQTELLKLYFDERWKEYGMIVSEGDAAVELADVIERKNVPEVVADEKGDSREVLREKKFVKMDSIPKE